VRLIAATHRDLEAMMQEGSFREDLFWRLNVVTINIPPLRERPEDIPLLARAFALSPRITGKGPKKINKEALDAIIAYSWPGNIRELQNVIERAIILAEADLITTQDLPTNLLDAIASPSMGTLKELEREAIVRALRMHGGHRVRAAKTLGISERNLYRKIREYSLEE
jgi:DNA-binding NtrC family response regulator